MKVYFDTDIILDVATAREPFCFPASQLLALAETQKIEGFTSATIFINVFYILRKLIGREKAILFLQDLEKILTVLPTSKEIVHSALYSDFTDFEDATQHFTALQIPVDYIVTRNLSDYSFSKIPVKTPSEFLEAFGK